MAIAVNTPLSTLKVLAAVEAQAPDTVCLSDEQVADGLGAAALQLAKRARLTPALLICQPAPGDVSDAPGDWLSVNQTDLLSLATFGPPRLQRVSEAHVAVALSENCTLVLFREVDGSAEHVAILVNGVSERGPDHVVTVRLHSSCLTGDLLGSLRCDCGDQLQRAMAHLASSGGVLLYLSQEGRGTGLANKLRAYCLQDRGLDTIDADRHLGFRGDERDYQVAVAMLNALGIQRIALLTNNPQKIDALRAGGIDVVERLPLIAPTNPHNERYIETKRLRAGHLQVEDEQGERGG
jgi:GTP cyclohydrolase II